MINNFQSGSKKIKQKLLFHICCAPCFVAPYFHLRKEFDLMGFWYNPNIHPYTEYTKRLDEVKRFVKKEKLKVIYKDEYHLEKWLQNVVFREKRRCDYCYYDRLQNAAIYAKRGNFDMFTSTLLYSKFQQHKKIIELGNDLAKKYGVKFLSRDLREYWNEGIVMSKQRNMYRQQYCGCIYSEKERYLKS